MSKAEGGKGRAHTTRRKRKKSKKPYQKPEIHREEIAENLIVLACGKCETGPIQQFMCQRFPSLS